MCPVETSLQTTCPGTAREREGNRKGESLNQLNQAPAGRANISETVWVHCYAAQCMVSLVPRPSMSESGNETTQWLEESFECI